MPDRPWHVGDLFWETWSEAALAARGQGRATEAARLWRLAAAGPFEPGDPRRAASLNNLALAGADPLSGLSAALEAWDAAEAWIAAMAVGPRGRSSTFHLRLEARHKDTIEASGRVMLRRDLDAGRAVTLANMVLVRPADDEAMRLIGAARDRRRAGWGPNEAGTLWLDRVVAARAAGSPTPPPPKLPWPERRPAGFTDERKLKGAVYLAAFAS